MKQDFYVFYYSTRTRQFKAISYGTPDGVYSLEGAFHRFNKNVRSVKLFSV